ncbi:MAG: hypothetical protein MZV70_34505 [Desulfobacterales bacterium]|nr:hypothetical protein [Desulfobacterales bacterium]
MVITFTGGFLADSVTMNRTTNDAWAHGHAFLSSEGDTLEGRHHRAQSRDEAGCGTRRAHVLRKKSPLCDGQRN